MPKVADFIWRGCWRNLHRAWPVAELDDMRTVTPFRGVQALALIAWTWVGGMTAESDRYVLPPLSVTLTIPVAATSEHL